MSPAALVLDLGAGGGSFPAAEYSFRTIHVDLDRERLSRDGLSVQADSAALPFSTATFDAVIVSHSLEHVTALALTMQELGRVARKSAAAYIAVPDGRTFSDRLYRKVFRDRGGHINLFDSSRKLAARLAWYLDLPHAGTTLLCTSFSYLNRENAKAPHIRRQMRIPALPEWLLRAMIPALATLDRFFRTRLLIYGWALYFGQIAEPLPTEPAHNVCIRCGHAHSPESLQRRAYTCPHCGALNRVVKPYPLVVD